MKKIISVVILTVSIGLLGCTKDSVAPTVTDFSLLSSAFTDNGTLPIDYTCDGASASPPLSWVGAPSGTKSFTITMNHIPAPGERHEYMILYNIPAATASIVKNVSGVGLFGINTVNGKTQYSPPCSQGPGAKLYLLTVYALSAEPVIGCSNCGNDGRAFKSHQCYYPW